LLAGVRDMFILVMGFLPSQCHVRHIYFIFFLLKCSLGLSYSQTEPTQLFHEKRDSPNKCLIFQVNLQILG
jgi:hypothetical protein